jgi:hypothetical protein
MNRFLAYFFQFLVQFVLESLNAIKEFKKPIHKQSRNETGVRHSGPVIQARDVQAHLFFTCLSGPILTSFRPKFFFFIKFKKKMGYPSSTPPGEHSCSHTWALPLHVYSSHATTYKNYRSTNIASDISLESPRSRPGQI